MRGPEMTEADQNKQKRCQSRNMAEQPLARRPTVSRLSEGTSSDDEIKGSEVMIHRNQSVVETSQPAKHKSIHNQLSLPEDYYRYHLAQPQMKKAMSQHRGEPFSLAGAATTTGKKYRTGSLGGNTVTDLRQIAVANMTERARNSSSESSERRKKHRPLLSSASSRRSISKLSAGGHMRLDQPKHSQLMEDIEYESSNDGDESNGVFTRQDSSSLPLISLNSFGEWPQMTQMSQLTLFKQISRVLCYDPSGQSSSDTKVIEQQPMQSLAHEEVEEEKEYDAEIKIQRKARSDQKENYVKEQRRSESLAHNLFDMVNRLRNLNVDSFEQQGSGEGRRDDEEDPAVKLYLFKEALINVNFILGQQCDPVQRNEIIRDGEGHFTELVQHLKEEKNEVQIAHLKHVFAATSIQNVHLYHLLARLLAEKCLKQAETLDDAQHAFSWNREAQCFFDKSKKVAAQQSTLNHDSDQRLLKELQNKITDQKSVLQAQENLAQAKQDLISATFESEDLDMPLVNKALQTLLRAKKQAEIARESALAAQCSASIARIYNIYRQEPEPALQFYAEAMELVGKDALLDYSATDWHIQAACEYQNLKRWHLDARSNEADAQALAQVAVEVEEVRRLSDQGANKFIQLVNNMYLKSNKKEEIIDGQELNSAEQLHALNKMAAHFDDDQLEGKPRATQLLMQQIKSCINLQISLLKLPEENQQMNVDTQHLSFISQLRLSATHDQKQNQNSASIELQLDDYDLNRAQSQKQTGLAEGTDQADQYTQNMHGKRTNQQRLQDFTDSRGECGAASTLPSTNAHQDSLPNLQLGRQNTLGFSIRIDGVKRELLLNVTSSSVMYFVLSFLTQIQIVRMGQLNRRFRDRFVPVTLGALTKSGTVPVNGYRCLTFAIQLEQSNNLLLMRVPAPVRENSCTKRSDFWQSFAWQANTQMTKFKRNKRMGTRKQFKFNYASWGTCVTFELQHPTQRKVDLGGGRVGTETFQELRSHIYILGGCNLAERTVTDRHVQVMAHSGFVMRERDLPSPKWAHAAAICQNKIIMVSGISDLARNMGMRSVPMADTDCHAYDIYSQEWEQLPDVPIGKLHSSLIVVNSRFVFQIGGYDDYDFDIYQLDIQNEQDGWRTLTLDTSIPIVDDLIYFDTREYLQAKQEQDRSRYERLGYWTSRDSEDDSDVEGSQPAQQKPISLEEEEPQIFDEIDDPQFQEPAMKRAKHDEPISIQNIRVKQMKADSDSDSDSLSQVCSELQDEPPSLMQFVKMLERKQTLPSPKISLLQMRHQQESPSPVRSNRSMVSAKSTNQFGVAVNNTSIVSGVSNISELDPVPMALPQLGLNRDTPVVIPRISRMMALQQPILEAQMIGNSANTRADDNSQSHEGNYLVSMLESLDDARPSDQDCIKQLGRGHFGAILLPRKGDDFEQMQINNRPNVPRIWRKGERLRSNHSEINILVFGGSCFKDREPNPNETDDKCYVLTIPPTGDTFTLKYLPGAKLRVDDKFFGNMHTRIDANKNTVTIFGQKSAHRINTGRTNVAHLRWKVDKEQMGYGAQRDRCNWSTRLPAMGHPAGIEFTRQLNQPLLPGGLPTLPPLQGGGGGGLAGLPTLGNLAPPPLLGGFQQAIGGFVVGGEQPSANGGPPPSQLTQQPPLVNIQAAGYPFAEEGARGGAGGPPGLPRLERR